MKPCLIITVVRQGVDIYGQKIDNHDANGELVECPVCKKSVAASRFAPHLEKCIGMGRSARPKRYFKQTAHFHTLRSNYHIAKVDENIESQVEVVIKRSRSSDSSSDEEPAYQEPESRSKRNAYSSSLFFRFIRPEKVCHKHRFIKLCIYFSFGNREFSSCFLNINLS